MYNDIDTFLFYFHKLLIILFVLYRCPAEVSGCGASCSARGDYNGVPPAAVARACTRDLVNHMLAVAAMDRAACLDADHKQGRWVLLHTVNIS